MLEAFGCLNASEVLKTLSLLRSKRRSHQVRHCVTLIIWRMTPFPLCSSKGKTSVQYRKENTLNDRLDREPFRIKEGMSSVSAFRLKVIAFLPGGIQKLQYTIPYWTSVTCSVDSVLAFPIEDIICPPDSNITLWISVVHPRFDLSADHPALLTVSNELKYLFVWMPPLLPPQLCVIKHLISNCWRTWC